ncbi:hypothetical protein ALC53_06321 [Atta colombica]|uniref:Uncharacterized protein n=1 Tax=Atta colombica TaxID=520822 RepID=A0A195BEN8_9HYME|nr:hypothetical protein ALC53_06321 [Atta colombica]
MRSSAITTEDNFQSAEESRNKERTYLPWSRNANCYDYENSIDISKNRRCKAKARKTSLPRNTPTLFSDHLFLRNIGDCAIPRARANLSMINHANAARRIVTRRYDSKTEAERGKKRKKEREREMNDWPRQVARARIARYRKWAKRERMEAKGEKGNEE